MAGDVPSPSPNPGPADLARPGVPAAPLALYRRYRPASFAEVKGQDHVTEPLRQALRSGRVHHAYLFSGPRGCGKTSSARILARSLNCELGPTPDPCGTCASCIALAPTGPGSIDVIEIDAASHGGVDDARDLRERAFYAPVSGRFKIYIIDEAHMVTREGFNALLKLVEEPPPHLKFVFATTEPEKVIATIRSRTHHYPFRLVPPAVLRELLEEILRSEGVAYEPTVLPVVIRAGAGSVRDSLSVLDQLIAGSDESGLSYERAVALLGYTDDALLDEVAKAFSEGDGAAVFRSIDRVVEAGHDPRRFAADLLDRFRDLIVLAAVPDAAASGLLDVPADRLDRMREQAAGFGQAQLTSAAETISAGLVEMRGATSPRLLLELMCAQVLLPAPSGDEQALLARLERLERRLESGTTGSAGPAGTAPERAKTTPEHVGTVPEHVGATPGRGGTAPQRPTAARGTGMAGPGDSGGRQESPPRGESRPPADMADASKPPGVTGRGPQSDRTQASGPPDTDFLRERWPEVLDAVESERKVAWLLLSNATVDSLTEGVLTLRFGKEGEARGFSGSGYDRELGQVLKAMFGVAPQIRAIAGTAQGQSGQGTGAPGSDAPGSAGQGTGAPGSDAPGKAGRGTGAPGSAGQGTGALGSAAQGSGAPGPGAAGGGAPGTAERGRAGQAQAAEEHAATGARPGREARKDSAHRVAGSTGGTGGTGNGGASRASIAMAGGTRPESAPDTADVTDADALSGLDLIQRELGGRIIEEIGES
jgi:DNA polymerase III subunit gamma/tau